MTTWKSDKHIVLGRIDTDQVVLGSLYCITARKIKDDFTRHHAIFGEFEVSCPQCGLDEKFGPENIVTDDGD